jgi:hypothetical protein
MNSGRVKMRWRRRLIKGVEGAALVTDHSDGGWIYVEEMGYIDFGILWVECVGNVAIGGVVMGKLQSVRVVHLPEPGVRRECADDGY